MHKEPRNQEMENQSEKRPFSENSQHPICRDVLEVIDITIEELAIDGICGVY